MSAILRNRAVKQALSGAYAGYARGFASVPDVMVSARAPKPLAGLLYPSAPVLFPEITLPSPSNAPRSTRPPMLIALPFTHSIPSH